MSSPLENKVVVITGAGRGIGKAIEYHMLLMVEKYAVCQGVGMKSMILQIL